MTEPKYKIGQTVYVYKAGDLVSREIAQVETVTGSDGFFSVSYYFKDTPTFFHTLNQIPTSEYEVFADPNDFINQMILRTQSGA